ncbi:MAG: TlpA family protein disulfide reductase [Candidatus Limimorpha sp.]
MSFTLKINVFAMRFANIRSLLSLLALLSVSVSLRCQTDSSELDTVNFADTALIGTEQLRNAISDYLTNAQDFSKPVEKQMYDIIIAADNVLSRCVSSFEMYKFVYHFMVLGFSEMGATLAVDYMMRMPYIEYLDATKQQREELYALAESFNRVKIGSVAPDIVAMTLNGTEFSLYDAESDYFVLLFWSFSCPHCRDMLKDISKYLSENDNVTVITVNVIGDRKRVRRLLRSLKVGDFNICDGHGWDSPIVRDFAVDMTPSLFVLDKDKKIIARPFGVNEILEIVR